MRSEDKYVLAFRKTRRCSFKLMLRNLPIDLFIVYLTALSVSRLLASVRGWQWVMNLKGCGRKRSWPNLRYCSGICLEGLRKTTKIISQASRSPGRDLNPGSPVYEAGELTARPRRFGLPVEDSLFRVGYGLLWAFTFVKYSHSTVEELIQATIKFSVTSFMNSHAGTYRVSMTT
jgi:hypothetical protein